jgi:hypothetical protein
MLAVVTPSTIAASNRRPPRPATRGRATSSRKNAAQIIRSPVVGTLPKR